MQTLEVLHQPEYFGFYIEDDGQPNHWSDSAGEEDVKSGFCVIRHGVSVRVLSEFSKIPIRIEYDESEIPVGNEKLWDHIVECSFEVRGTQIRLTTATSKTPIAIIPARRGGYRVRIHWGGQLTGKDDGETEDFYLLQFWPSAEKATVFLKGEQRWPRPEQAWEREIRLASGN